MDEDDLKSRQAAHLAAMDPLIREDMDAYAVASMGGYKLTPDGKLTYVWFPPPPANPA